MKMGYEAEKHQVGKGPLGGCAELRMPSKRSPSGAFTISRLDEHNREILRVGVKIKEHILFESAE